MGASGAGRAPGAHRSAGPLKETQGTAPISERRGDYDCPFGSHPRSPSWQRGCLTFSHFTLRPSAADLCGG